jgi:hypothetical protein
MRLVHSTVSLNDCFVVAFIISALSTTTGIAITGINTTAPAPAAAAAAAAAAITITIATAAATIATVAAGIPGMLIALRCASMC